MDNETTMPVLLTRPAILAPSDQPRPAGVMLYTFIFLLALLVLAVGALALLSGRGICSDLQG
jgi:hypothetical protein